MPLFQHGLSETEKAEALKLVYHVQLLFAFQQLTMERYNDAITLASGIQSGDETTRQYYKGQTWTGLVQQHVLPAVTFKLDIIGRMVAAHREIRRPTLSQLTKAYDTSGAMLAAILRRAEAQQAGWQKWLTDPAMEAVDTPQFDRDELKALDAAIDSINDVIFKRLKLNPTVFMEINTQATNCVRSTIGLAPLSQDEYAAKYAMGLSGTPVRFYSA